MSKLILHEVPPGSWTTLRWEASFPAGFTGLSAWNMNREVMKHSSKPEWLKDILSMFVFIYFTVYNCCMSHWEKEWSNSSFVIFKWVICNFQSSICNVWVSYVTYALFAADLHHSSVTDGVETCLITHLFIISPFSATFQYIDYWELLAK